MDAGAAGWFSAEFFQDVVISLLGTLGSLGIALIGFVFATRQSKAQQFREAQRARVARGVAIAEAFLDRYHSVMVNELRRIGENPQVSTLSILDFLRVLNWDQQYNFLTVARAMHSVRISKAFIETEPVSTQFLASVMTAVTTATDNGAVALPVDDYRKALNEFLLVLINLQILVAAAEISEGIDLSPSAWDRMKPTHWVPKLTGLVRRNQG